MVQSRNFFKELEEDKFKPVTYGIFNKIDDDGYVTYLENKYKDKFSLEDFKYYDFELTDKEKFLLYMHNREYLKNVKELNQELSKYEDIILYVKHDNGLIRVVKFNKIKL